VLGSLRSGREQVVDPDPGSEPSDIAGISRLLEIGSKVPVGRYSFVFENCRIAVVWVSKVSREEKSSSSISCAISWFTIISSESLYDAETRVEARPLIGETLAPSGSEFETAVSV
jgi:hypothetical protein